MFSFKELQSECPMHYSLSEIALKSGFKFRDIENRRLDWKTLGCINVNKVIEHQDFEFLEKIIPKIIEAPMQSILGTSAIDAAVPSLFRLAQMSLQYLSFCQQFMSHTLYDLRTAFNQLQKKYTNLKQNYKCLEEQHYKAQEQIQFLLSENKCELNRVAITVAKPSSLFPCDQCTKNFLTADSLKSHVQRKHLDEKNESCDENEKDKEKEKEKEIEKEKQTETENEIDMDTKKEIQKIDDENLLEKGEERTKHNIDNNNEGETSANCTTCSDKTQIHSSSVAIQCEVVNIDPQDIAIETNPSNVNETTEKCVSDLPQVFNSELIQNAYQTISDLKNEIIELKNSLLLKMDVEASAAEHTSTNDNIQSNDKISVIEQKFNEFEIMYTNSQHQFIESFRTLDERQKVYMDNIQETIKEIVEKSLVQHDSVATDNILETNQQVQNTHPIETVADEIEQTQNDVDAIVKNHLTDNSELNSIKNQARPTVTPRTIHSNVSNVLIESTSQSEDDEKSFVCQVEVHNNFKNETDKKNINRSKQQSSGSGDSKMAKDMAIDEFEQRLRQFGVDADSTGLNTPRSCEVNQDLVEERIEMKKANKSFEKTRKKLQNEINRIAKVKLASASSVTSLSSTSYQSDDQSLDQFDGKMLNNRPKSASVEKLRKRNAKKLMRKLVENDIDENDIIDKMQIAQKALNAHRECIQELLQTTTHSPSTLTKIKTLTTNGIKDKDLEAIQNDGDSELNLNRYNKMPNITTRRVVFVNLDEDS